MMNRWCWKGITWFWGNPKHETAMISFYECSRRVESIYGIAFGGKLFGVINCDVEPENIKPGLMEIETRKFFENKGDQDEDV